VEIARAAQALAQRVSPSNLKMEEYLKYSIFNIQSTIVFFYGIGKNNG
jgi:hypothetical protein